MNESSPGPAIEVRGISKRYGRTPVLRDLDLDVSWGEAMIVLGANGFGKTTLIKILATLTRPDSGTVRIAGLDVARSGQHARRLVGVVAHETMVYEQFTCEENLRFAGRLFGLDHLNERIEGVASKLGLTKRLRQRAGTLSHGFRKRLSIARALLHDPPVLLLDEPDSGLDQEALSLLDVVLSDGTQAGRTAVITTHNLNRGLALGSRVVVLARGRIAHDEQITASSDRLALRETYERYMRVF